MKRLAARVADFKKVAAFYDLLIRLCTLDIHLFI